MTSRKQMIKTLKEAGKNWEKTYLPKSMIEDIVFLLEDRDKKEKKPGKLTVLPGTEEQTDDAQS